MLKNHDRVQQQIAQLSNRLSIQAAQRTLSAAQSAGARARGRAPVDTGRLRDSIRWEQDASLGARMFTDCPYAAAVELGSRSAPPRPFMRG